MENNGPRFTLTGQGQKRTFGIPLNLTNKKVHKVTIRYKDTQGDSQEVELKEMATKYVKPKLGHREEYKIVTSNHPNTDWGNPSLKLWRNNDELEDKQVHTSSWQAALKEEYFKSQNRPVGQMTDEDWINMIRWIAENGSARVIKPQVTTTFKTGPKKFQPRVTPAVSVVLHHPDADKVHPCYLIREGKYEKNKHYPICEVADCLSHNGVTYSGKRCQAHYGKKAYAAVELTTTNNNKNHILSMIVKFGYESADERRKEDRLIFTIKQRLGDKDRSGWGNYISILKAQGKKVEYSIDRVIFDNPDDAEKYLALLDTTRLIAHMAGGKKKGESFEIINLSLALSFKNEEEMEIYLREEYKTSIKCVPTQSSSFPTWLGREPSPGSTPTAEEVTIYLQGNEEVVYTGKCDSEKFAVASDKSNSKVFQNYSLSQGRSLNQYPIVYCKKERGDELEQLINFSNYIGHLFQLSNRFTGTNFVCLNKEIRVTFLEGKWAEVQEICRWLYAMEITLSTS